MTKKSENDLYFEKIQERYFNILVNTYDTIVNQGNDKGYSKFWAAMPIIFSNFGNQNPYIKEIIDIFKHNYKLGFSIDNVLFQIPALKIKHLKLMEEEREKNKKTTYHYKNKLLEYLKIPSVIFTTTSPGAYFFNADFILKTDNKDVLKLLIKYFAVQRFFNERQQTELDEINVEDVFERLFPKNAYLNKTIGQPEISGTAKSTGLKWTGQNKTEFIQLVYSLYHANLITNDTNEITKIVQEFAEIFKIDLGKNWQSNLSKSINDRNSDYIPKIFDNLKAAFINYTKSVK